MQPSQSIPARELTPSQKLAEPTVAYTGADSQQTVPGPDAAENTVILIWIVLSITLLTIYWVKTSRLSRADR